LVGCSTRDRGGQLHGAIERRPNRHGTGNDNRRSQHSYSFCGAGGASPNALFNLSKLSVWWFRLGIQIERIKPCHALLVRPM
jgi:hypothetical protein